ncbi:MAG: permease-like cell division protein FtsX [bacterium]
MATTLYRILKHGFQNFWRQRLLSIATLIVMILALLVFEGLTISSFVGKTALNTIQDKIDISVYFETTAAEDKILDIKRTLQTLEEVKSVDYISRHDALELFKERHKDDETISKALEELGDNPLSASLNIKAKNPEQYSVIASYLENDALQGFVKSVDYNQNKVVIDRLTAMINVVRQVGVALIVALTFAAILVTFNTILLAIYSNKEEIGIMRLVGASDFFIRGPYIVEGILYGVISAILSTAITAPIVFFVSPYMHVFISSMDLAAYFTGNIFSLFGYQLLFGIGIGVISSIIAIRKYLKV